MCDVCDIPCLNCMQICIHTYSSTSVYIYIYIHIHSNGVHTYSIETIHPHPLHSTIHPHPLHSSIHPRIAHCIQQFIHEFNGYHLFYRALLQKRPIILRSLLIEVTPYDAPLHPIIHLWIECISTFVYTYIYIHPLPSASVSVYIHIYIYRILSLL